MSDIAKQQVLLEDGLNQLETNIVNLTKNGIPALEILNTLVAAVQNVSTEPRGGHVWAYNFVASLSEDQKECLFNVLSEEYDLDTEEQEEIDDGGLHHRIMRDELKNA